MIVALTAVVLAQISAPAIVANLKRQELRIEDLQERYGLFATQTQLSTGLKVLRPSDDIVAAGTASVLDDIIERRDQWIKNLSKAENVLNTLDHAIGDGAAAGTSSNGSRARRGFRCRSPRP